MGGGADGARQRLQIDVGLVDQPLADALQQRPQAAIRVPARSRAVSWLASCPIRPFRASIDSRVSAPGTSGENEWLPPNTRILPACLTAPPAQLLGLRRNYLPWVARWLPDQLRHCCWCWLATGSQASETKALRAGAGIQPGWSDCVWNAKQKGAIWPAVYDAEAKPHALRSSPLLSASRVLLV